MSKVFGLFSNKAAAMNTVVCRQPIIQKVDKEGTEQLWIHLAYKAKQMSSATA
jgi:hypothetical protein